MLGSPHLANRIVVVQQQKTDRIELPLTVFEVDLQGDRTRGDTPHLRLERRLVQKTLQHLEYIFKCLGFGQFQE